MPSDIAPIQVVIIPIIFKEKEKSVMEACENLYKKLREEGIKSHIDKRDITPGNKYYDWELKGVPIRVEIGPKDIEKKEVVIVRRDTSNKNSVSQTTSVEQIKEELSKVSENLYNNAKKLLDDNVHRVQTIEEAKNFNGIVELPWCGVESCALEIEDILEGNTLGEPIEEVKCEESCPVCRKPAITWMRYAKTY
jgi:prolyl-tRNA synthetase